MREWKMRFNKYKLKWVDQIGQCKFHIPGIISPPLYHSCSLSRSAESQKDLHIALDDGGLNCVNPSWDYWITLHISTRWSSLIALNAHQSRPVSLECVSDFHRDDTNSSFVFSVSPQRSVLLSSMSYIHCLSVTTAWQSREVFLMKKWSKT